MADILLKKVLNNEINTDSFLNWLSSDEQEQRQPEKKIATYSCTRDDFVTYLLNFVHEEIPSCLQKLSEASQNVSNDSEVGARKLTINETPKRPDKTAPDLNRSYSLPADSNGITSTSTPQNPRINPDTSISCPDSSYASPVSPLYRNHNSFSTPKSHHTTQTPKNQHQNIPHVAPQSSSKSTLCLADFLVTNKQQRSSSKKKHQQQLKNFDSSSSSVSTTYQGVKRRINPTNLVQQDKNGFHRSGNSFNFSDTNEISVDNASEQRNVLAEERIRILTRCNTDSCLATSPKKIKHLVPLTQPQSHVKVSLGLVTCRDKLDNFVRIYAEILKTDLVLNLISEVYFLVSLLLKKVSSEHGNISDLGVANLNDSQDEISSLFSSTHNVVYFAAKSLESQTKVLSNYDRTTLKLLAENDRLRELCPEFSKELSKLASQQASNECHSSAGNSVRSGNVCFNLDTDNRSNFPSDPSFHAFKKQRDLFYEILRLWETQRLTPDFSFAQSLGGKIKSLLSLHGEPSNLVHFSRLFKSQLLSTCCRSESEVHASELLGALSINAVKLNRLQNRFVTKQSQNSGDGNDNFLPGFSGQQEFYRDFIVVAANHAFNRHLEDALSAEILELNDGNFCNHDLDDRENDVGSTTKNSYYNALKSLRLLAKFLGFIESLPYQTDSCIVYSDNLLATHLQIRRQTQPVLNLLKILENSIDRGSVILSIPWISKYLAMLDYVTLRLPHYTAASEVLYRLYRTFSSPVSANVYLVKFCLGWLFDLPHYPNVHYSTFNSEHAVDSVNEVTKKVALLDHLKIVDQEVLYCCCPHLGDIKKLLMSNSNKSHNAVTIKHITPVTAVTSPETQAKKRLEQQLEEAFFHGQPVSTRKTVEFVSERVASACVKHICYTVVPTYKKTAIQKLRTLLSEQQDHEKIFLKSKSQQFAATCCKELQVLCEKETNDICSKKIPGAIESLVSLDTHPKTIKVCAALTKKSCWERVRQWMTSHINSGIFTKDFDEEIEKILANAGTDESGTCNIIKRRIKREKPTFGLPPGGRDKKHDDETFSGAHLMERLRYLSIAILERKTSFEESQVLTLLNDICRSIEERCDVNDCILATICTSLIDCFLLLAAHHPHIVEQPSILSRSCEIWRLYYNGCDDLFKSLLCVRTVGIFAQSNDVSACWRTFARFCLFLIEEELLSCDSFESQCTGIFKTEWDKVSLKHITDFMKLFVKLYRQNGCPADNFAFVLDFLSDYCDDL